MNFIPRRQNAKMLLEDFIKNKVEKYDAERNFDYGIGNRRTVSCLSPYISRGVLKEKYVLCSVIKSKKKSNKFVQEVFWRIYWKGWLEQKRIVWDNFKASIYNYEKDSGLKLEIYKKACVGNTKIIPFDIWVKQLLEYGYLHNHTRMWFASIWIHYLGLPWQLGAKLFLENLLDADPAANTLSWRWVAGIQTKGKKYIASKENINKYTKFRFDRFELPSLKNINLQDEIIHENNIEYSSNNNNSDSQDGLIIFDNELYPENLYKNIKNYKYIIILSFEICKIDISNHALNFKNTLCMELLEELKKNGFNVFLVNLPKEKKRFYTIIEKNRIRSLAYSYLTVGFEKDIFDDTIKFISKDIKLECLLDNFYLEAWKHSKKGFFNFKKQIPNLIEKFVKLS